MKYFKFLFAVLLASSISTSILASEKAPSWYQIEVIIFSQSDQSGVHSENWPTASSNKLLASSVDLTKPFVIQLQPKTPELAVPFQELSKSAFELKLTDAKLEKSSRYKRLVHKAWIQSVARDQKSIPVLLDDSDHATNAYQALADEPIPNIPKNTRSLDRLLDTTEKLAQDSFVMEELEASIDWPTFFPTMIPPLASFDNDLNDNWELYLSDFTPEYVNYASNFTPRETMGPPNHSVFGTLGLRMGRFLHLELDVVYRAHLNRLDENILTSFSLEEYMDDNSVGETALLSNDALSAKNTINTINNTPALPILYRLKDSMRIKSGKIYYFDHPLFGVITMVNKYELPLEQNPETIATE